MIKKILLLTLLLVGICVADSHACTRIVYHGDSSLYIVGKRPFPQTCMYTRGEAVLSAPANREPSAGHPNMAVSMP